MIEIGTIVKPQGIKGEVKIITFASADRCKNIKKLFIDKKEVVIESLAVRKGDLYLKLLGVDDRNAAEELRNKTVFANVSDLNVLKENEFYFSDLIGASVVDLSNKKVGELIDIEQYGAADVFIVKESSGIYSIPFIDEIFIKVEPLLLTIDNEKYNNLKIVN